MTSDLNVCVAGCGRMGQPMLAALRGNDVKACGFDIRAPESYGNFAGAMTNDPSKLDQNTNVLISVVRDIPQTEELLFGTQNLLVRLPHLEFLVISSTVSPKYFGSLIPRIGNLNLVDAPMSGAAVAAEEARLSFMLGGEAADLKTLDPLFKAMGSHFHHMGDTGAGMTAKVLNNLIAAGSTAMTRLALEWAEQSGLEREDFLKLVHTSSGQNWFASGFENIEFSRDGFADDNSIGLLKKDVESALDAMPDTASRDLPDAVIKEVLTFKPID